MILNRQILSAVVFACSLSFPVLAQSNAAHPGDRTIMDAHNCYPYFEWWYDRIDRALSAGTPLAIEQDLYWYTDPKTGKSQSLVAHGDPHSGNEPTMEHYFFDKVRPTVERALKSGDKKNWPIITLNLDFKTNEPEHIEAVLALLTKYQDWLTTAVKTSDPAALEPLDVKPILVLTGENDTQQTVFYDNVPVGGKLLVFGAVHNHDQDPMAAPEILETEKASNYRRWWNNPWGVVEKGGQNHAGKWTAEDNQRLQSLVQHAHANGLWIRFYTLDGATEKELSANGWFHGYNFGSHQAAHQRWQAAQQAGADYIASDEYEELAVFLKHKK